MPNTARVKNTQRTKMTTILTPIALALALASSAPVFSQAVSPEQKASDKAGLQGDVNQLETDKAKLKADRSSGRMDGVSKDALQVERDKRAIKRTKTAISKDEPGSAQKAADKAALKAER